jgi:hypothetical protein
VQFDPSDSTIQAIDKLNPEWVSVLREIFSMEKRIMRYGNVKSRIALLSAYENYLTYEDIRPPLQEGSVKEMRFMLEIILKQVAVLHSFTSTEKAGSDFSITRSEYIHLDETYDLLNMYLQIAVLSARLKDVRNAVVYFNKARDYMHERLRSTDKDMNFEEELQKMPIFFAVLGEVMTMSKQTMVNLVSDEIVCLGKLKNERKDAAEKKLCNDMIGTFKEFKTFFASGKPYPQE